MDVQRSAPPTHETTRRAARWIRAFLDWAPPAWEPRSALVRVLLGVGFFGFCVAATWVTLFGSPDAAIPASVEAYFRSGALPDGTPWIREHFAALYLPLLAIAVGVRFGVTFFGTLRHEKVTGERLPLGYLTTMMLTNVVFVYLPLAVMGAIGLGATLFGVGYEAGAGWIASVGAAVGAAIERSVPTLVTIPYPWPLVLAMIPAGLGYYGWHRLQHSWRPLWLLSHRAHHSMIHLVQPASLPASNPLAFLANTIPQALLIGTTTKLFAAEPMLLESMLWVVLSHTATEVFNHTEAVYRWTLGGPVRRFWFHFLGHGAWHQVHHSSASEHRLVNIGGGPFMLWDRVFGTFVDPPLPKPAMGLTGRPPVRFTPLRLALAGHLEMLQEFALNRSWRDRFLILLGPSSYVPPRAVSHLIAEP